MEAANGVLVVLEAFGLLDEPGFRLVVAGGGALAGRVEEAARRDSRIEYRGLLKLHDVLSMYRAADLLINMRLTRTMRTRYFFPSKLMEFLASGTPVLTTCTGNVAEEYGGMAFLLQDESARGLADAIRRARATSEEARREMGSRARAYMLQQKSWRAQSARVAALLRSVACR